MQVNIVGPQALGDLPAKSENSIGEKLLIKRGHNNWLEIRRMPVNCSDSAEKMRAKNLEDLGDLPSIRID